MPSTQYDVPGAEFTPLTLEDRAILKGMVRRSGAPAIFEAAYLIAMAPTPPNSLSREFWAGLEIGETITIYHEEDVPPSTQRNRLQVAANHQLTEFARRFTVRACPGGFNITRIE